MLRDSMGAAAGAFRCPWNDIDRLGPVRGTVYDDGEADWRETFIQRSTGDAVTVYAYAHDDTLRAGEISYEQYPKR